MPCLLLGSVSVHCRTVVGVLSTFRRAQLDGICNISLITRISVSNVYDQKFWWNNKSNAKNSCENTPRHLNIQWQMVSCNGRCWQFSSAIMEGNLSHCMYSTHNIHTFSTRDVRWRNIFILMKLSRANNIIVQYPQFSGKAVSVKAKVATWLDHIMWAVQ